MTAPTQRQLDYLNTLIKQSGLTQDEWRESVGLYEHNAFGRRLRAEIINRAAVSRWIADLKSAA